MKPEVVTIGLGYIGLPTSALIASNRVNVLGVDINQQIVDNINIGKIHIVEPDLDNTVEKVVEKGFFRASTSPESASVYLIVVPTPFKKNHEPDISYIKSATDSIIPLLKKDDLYIIESTSPVGTTNKMKNIIYRQRPDLKDNIFIAYCPERVLPGNVMNELIYNDRVIGGINERSTIKARDFYRRFVKGELHCTDDKTAEMCKLVENSSRDVQIAFANELSLICEKANINVWELINLANKHPRVNILNPGCGVGGHCIAVDPYFITSKFPLESKIIGKAREINNYKSLWCIEKIQNVIMDYELKKGKKPLTALMGLSFKPNIDDLRESPAKYIAEQLLKNSNKNKFLVVEPNLKNSNVFELSHYENAIDMADVIIFLVAHKEFKSLVISSEKLIIDFCGIIKNKI